MIQPHVPELALPEGPARDRATALRALRNCGVIRVTIGAVPRGYRILQKDGLIYTRAAEHGAKADCRLNEAGHEAARGLKGPQ